MSKRNIENDLLKIFKNKSYDEIINMIVLIAEGQYIFKLPYLNKIPNNELLIYLEKVIVLGTRQTKIPDLPEEQKQAIEYFATNIKKIKYSDVNKKNLLSFKYSIMLAKERLKVLAGKKEFRTRTTSLFLAGILFVTLCMNNRTSSKKSNFDSGINSSSEELSHEKSELGSKYVLGDGVGIYPLGVSKKSEVEKILEMYNLTEYEFDVICAIAISESKTGSYEDTYAVINTIYNRTISKKWVEWISYFHGEDVGRNLYYQAITPGQFVVYENGKYKEYLGIREGEPYQAVIDFLLTRELKHDCLSFKSSNTDLNEYIQFVEGGNRFHDPMTEEDRIIEEELNKSTRGI